MLLRTNNINTHIAILILFFIVNVSFLASLFQSIYFLLTFQRSFTITIIAYISVIFMYILYLYKENFLQNYLIFIQNTFVINYTEKCINILEKLKKNNSNKLWFFIYGYLSLSILHILMYSYLGIDIFFESLYQGFNIIRLAFFPVVVLFYIYKIIEFEGISTQATKTAGKTVAKIIENPGGNPRTAVVLFGTIAITTAIKANGKNRKEQLEESKKIITTDDVDPALVAEPANQELKTAFIEKVKIDTLCTGSSASIAYEDLKGLLPGNKTVGTRLEEATQNLKIQNVLAEGARAIQQNQVQQAQTFGHSPAAKALSSNVSTNTPQLPNPNSVIEWSILDFF